MYKRLAKKKHAIGPRYHSKSDNGNYDIFIIDNEVDNVVEDIVDEVAEEVVQEHLEPSFTLSQEIRANEEYLRKLDDYIVGPDIAAVEPDIIVPSNKRSFIGPDRAFRKLQNINLGYTPSRHKQSRKLQRELVDEHGRRKFRNIFQDLIQDLKNLPKRTYDELDQNPDDNYEGFDDRYRTGVKSKVPRLARIYFDDSDDDNYASDVEEHETDLLNELEMGRRRREAEHVVYGDIAVSTKPTSSNFSSHGAGVQGSFTPFTESLEELSTIGVYPESSSPKIYKIPGTNRLVQTKITNKRGNPTVEYIDREPVISTGNRLAQSNLSDWRVEQSRDKERAKRYQEYKNWEKKISERDFSGVTGNMFSTLPISRPVLNTKDVTIFNTSPERDPKNIEVEDLYGKMYGYPKRPDLKLDRKKKAERLKKVNQEKFLWSVYKKHNKNPAGFEAWKERQSFRRSEWANIRKRYPQDWTKYDMIWDPLVPPNYEVDRRWVPKPSRSARGGNVEHEGRVIFDPKKGFSDPKYSRSRYLEFL